MSRLTGWIPILAVLTAGCGAGAEAPPRQPAGGGEARAEADLDRARALYHEGSRSEGAAVLRAAVAGSDPLLRARALQIIGDVRDPGLLPEVHRALGDESLEVRESASRVLQWLGDASSLAPLRDALSDPEGIVRSNAAEALARIGGAGEIAALRLLVESDADPGVRSMTAAALGGIRDPAVVPILAAALADENALVRSRAAEALGETGLAEGREPLRKAAAADPDGGVRAAAEAALRRLHTVEE